MSARHPWASTPGRHSPDYLEKHPMPASPAASLPLHLQPLLSTSQAVAEATAWEARLAAEPKVQCEVCGLCGPSSQIPDIGRGPRCANTDACTKRQMDKLYATRVPEVPALPAEPAPLPPPASPALEPLPRRVPAVVPEAVPVLPPAQEAALTAFNKASDEQDAAEAGQDRTEDEEPAEAAAEPPADDGDGAEPDAAPAIAEGSEPEDGGEGK
jgi:hypothetical protein